MDWLRERVEHRLLELNWTWKDFADRLDVHPATVTRYFEPGRTLRLDTKAKMKQVLGVDADFFAPPDSLSSKQNVHAAEGR